MVTKTFFLSCIIETLNGCITNNMYTPHLKRFPVYPTYIIAAGGVMIVPDV